jgi:hypothetical protein
MYVTSPPSAPLVFFTFMMLLAPETNSEPHGVTLAGYCYAIRHGMKVQIVTAYRVSHLQPYGVTVQGNVTCVYPPLTASSIFLFEKPTFPHIIRKFSTFYGARMFISVFTTAPHLSPSQADRTLQSTTSHPTSLTAILISIYFVYCNWVDTQ